MVAGLIPTKKLEEIEFVKNIEPKTERERERERER